MPPRDGLQGVENTANTAKVLGDASQAILSEHEINKYAWGSAIKQSYNYKAIRWWKLCDTINVQGRS